MPTYAFRIVNVFAEDAASPAIRSPCSRTRAAWTTRRCRRSRCSSTCPRPRSSCRPIARRRTCASSRRPSRCRSPVIRRSARRTSFARCANPGDTVTLEMSRGDHPGRRARRRLDAAGEPAAARGRSRPSRADLAAMLVLAEADVAPDPAAPPLWVDTGSEQLIVPLASADAVRRAAPRADLLLAHGHTGQRAMAYVFAPDPQRDAPRRRARDGRRGSSSRSTARSSRIRAPARRAPISAAG